MNGLSLEQQSLAVAQAVNGDVFVVGVDANGNVWLNHYGYTAGTWSGWTCPGGGLVNTSLMSAAIAPNGAVWFAGEDVGNRFWINSWDGTGFGGWIMLPNGVFSPTSSPQIAIPSDGTIYVVGKDIGGRVWTDSVIPSLVNPLVPTFTGWQDRQGVIYGQPSVTAGQDGFVYVAARSASSNSPVYITQIPAGNASTANTWLNGNGLIDSDPKIASQITSEIQSEGGTIYLTALAAANIPYVVPFVESTQTFGTWSYFNQPLTDDTIGWLNGEVYIAGRDSSESIHWYDVNTGALVPGTFGTAAGALTAGVSTATPDSSTLNLNGGANSGQINAIVPLTFSFTDTDPANGATNIAYAQFALVDSSGNYNCYGDWGPPSALDLYLPTVRGTTTNVNPLNPLNNSFCAVSLASITDTSASAVTAEVNFTFSPTSAGTYTIMQQVNYFAGGVGPWESLGTLTIGPPSGPAVWITDLTSGNYFVGNSYSVTVTGQANQQVTVSVDGGTAVPAVNAQGSSTTNAQGIWTTTGVWAATNVGNYAETYYVAGLQTSAGLSFQVAAGAGTYTCGMINIYNSPRTPGTPLPFTVNIAGITNANPAAVTFSVGGNNTNAYQSTTPATAQPPSSWSGTVNTTGLLGTYSVTPTITPAGGGTPTYCTNAVAFFQVASTTPGTPGPVSCASMTGTWTDTIQQNNPTFTWSSLVDTYGSISGGPVTDTGVCGINFSYSTVSGTHSQSTGQYSLTASGGSPSSFSCNGTVLVTVDQTITGTIQGQSCGLGTGTHTGGNGTFGDTMTIERIPSGELTSLANPAWGTAYGYATTAIFNVALTSPTGSNYNFGGRSVQEVIPSQNQIPEGYAGSDGCWWNGAPWPVPITRLQTQSTWGVQSSGQSGAYGPDYVGFNDTSVAYAQMYSPLLKASGSSCTTQYPQMMMITKESVAQPAAPTVGQAEVYGTQGLGFNLIQFTMYPNAIEIGRGSAMVLQEFQFYQF